MSREYCDHLIDILSPWGKVTAKSMFGGYGLYYKNLIFGIVDEDVPYFKVDDENRGDYEDAGMPAFSYEAKGGKRAVMSYWQVPLDVLEDSEMLAEWAEKAHKVTLRAEAKKAKKAPKK